MASIEQQITKQLVNEYALAHTYLSTILSINGIRVPRRQLELLAFISTRGIASVSARSEFCSTFNSSQNTINNMVSELYERGLVVKDSRKIKVNPMLGLDFSKDIVLNITLSCAH